LHGIFFLVEEFVPISPARGQRPVGKKDREREREREREIERVRRRERD